MNFPNASPDREPEPPPVSLGIPFENTLARLGEAFSLPAGRNRASAPQLIQLNTALARQLGLEPELFRTPDGVAVLAGNRFAERSEPVALAYAGHQFGSFVPRLGDGRAMLLGELRAPDGRRYNVQLKGSGRTPFSRSGDGRAALGPVLREYLVSEAMAALGVPTTRALAAVATGDPVFRETVLPGAVLTRVASSHLRIGSMEYLAAQGHRDALRVLVNYTLERHFPASAGNQHPALTLLREVVDRQARLVAQWMHLGFIHGVMNTDNTSLSGETLDYGPCAFMDHYDPATVFSAIDQMGRYAYGNQPGVLLWNLTRLAEALLILIGEEEGSPEKALAAATTVLEGFAGIYQKAWLEGFRRKLGLDTDDDQDLALIEDLLERMYRNGADFTLTFRGLADQLDAAGKQHSVRELFTDPESFDAWAEKWRARLRQEAGDSRQRSAQMRQANPLCIPRNHQVEAALRAAVEEKNYLPFEELLEAVTHPFEERDEWERFTLPPRPEERIRNTFCGT
jgi:uncharacterized protein YdiU (UPF0061 family)